MIKKNNVLLISLIIVFVFFVIEVVTNNIVIYDNNIYNFIERNFINDFNTKFLKIITEFGSALYFTIISFILIILIKNKKTKLLIPSNVLLVTAINLIIKEIVKRPRPSINRLVSVSGYSFPSGHSMSSIAFYGYLIYLIHQKISNKYLKWLLIIILSILILLIGISRIYLGVHYASDVISGFLAGAIYLILFIRYTKK